MEGQPKSESSPRNRFMKAIAVVLLTAFALMSFLSGRECMAPVEQMQVKEQSEFKSFASSSSTFPNSTSPIGSRLNLSKRNTSAGLRTVFSGNIECKVGEGNGLALAAEVNGTRRRLQMQPLACQEKLDYLDDIFDKRRDARRRCTGPFVGMNMAKPRVRKEAAKFLFDLYEPEATCFSDERFGQSIEFDRYQAFGDGPKFLCGVDLVAEESQKLGDCLVYSVGSNNQIDFEVSVYRYIPKCEIHTFDPTLPKNSFVGSTYSTFHPWGLGSEGQISSMKRGGEVVTFETKSLLSIKEALGHKGRKIDILKIDCEGCEWNAMPVIFASIATGELVINQIQIELHPDGSNPSSFMLQIREFFEAADKAKMRIFHKERNHWGCDGYRCLEYAFVSESFLRRANRHIVC